MPAEPTLRADGQVTNQLDPMQSLTGALVEVNEQLLVLYQLASITTESLDESEAVAAILEKAKSLLATDLLAFSVDGQEVHSTNHLTADSPSPHRRRDDRQIQQGEFRGGVLKGKAPNQTSVEVSNGTLGASLYARRDSRTFGTADHKLLTAIASMALGAVQTSRHHHEAVEGAVAMRDHDTASELAQLALPNWRPDLPGVDVYARSDPARAAGGDLFTFAVLGEVLHFVAGDVSGKGLPAALMMTTVISAATAAFQSAGASGPGAVLEAIDGWVHAYLAEAGLFVTLMAGSYDIGAKRLSVASAGHGPIFYLDDDGSRSIDSVVPPIGVLPLSDLGPVEDTVIPTVPSSRLVVSSDGFTEQQDPAGTMWGEERMLDVLTGSDLPAAELGELLFERLEAHAGTADQTDDRTLLILSTTSTGPTRD